MVRYNRSGAVSAVQNDPPSRAAAARTTVANAATGGAGPLPAITTSFINPIPVVSVTLDTERLGDLSVLLDFTAIISLPLAVNVNLNFQLLRSIDNGPLISIGPLFTFARTVTSLETDSFGFQAYDREIDGDSVTYSVVVATSSTISVAAAVTVLNATLSAVGTGRETLRMRARERDT